MEGLKQWRDDEYSVGWSWFVCINDSLLLLLARYSNTNTNGNTNTPLPGMPLHTHHIRFSNYKFSSRESPKNCVGQHASPPLNCTPLFNEKRTWKSTPSTPLLNYPQSQFTLIEIIPLKLFKSDFVTPESRNHLFICPGVRLRGVRPVFCLYSWKDSFTHSIIYPSPPIPPVFFGPPPISINLPPHSHQ